MTPPDSQAGATAFRAARWSIVEIGTRYVIQFAVTAVLARLLSPDAFGLLAMVLIFTAIGAIFIDSGSGAALVQKQSTTADEETTVFVVNVLVSLIAGLMLFACAGLIASFFNQPELAGLCRFMALIFPLNGLAVVPDALLTQRMRFNVRAKIEFGSAMTASTVALVLAWRGYGAWSLAWQAVVSIGARAVLLLVITEWRPHGRFRPRALWSIWSFGGFMLLAGLIDTGYTRLQALLVGRFFAARELGFYTMAQNTQQVPTSLAAALLNRLGLPLFSSLRHDPTLLHRAVRGSLSMSMFVFVPLVAMLALFATPVVELVFGPRWQATGPILAILALGALPWPSHVLNVSLLNALGHPRLVLRNEVIKKSLAVALLLAACPFGIGAIAWSTVAASLFAMGINMHYSGKLLGYGASSQLRDMAGIVLGTLVAVSLAYVVYLSMQRSLVALLAGCLVGAAAYLLLAWRTSHPALVDLLRLARPQRGDIR
nr:lipopolysaccharide biosynthesis protein [Pinirhizobacter soli]